MAITLDYVSTAGIEGNDYKGATFTDGAYTSATKTLTKAGAFAATKVNHYLYLESNDGGSIVAGYYKVATVPDANTVTLATDAGAGVDDDAAKCTQHDGTTTKPWRSLQGAFDLCTRNTTDGNQVNLKAGTAHVNAASLDLTTFIAAGALAAAAPLIVRGYTAAANDGGIGEIDCNGATMWAAETYDYIGMINLECHTFGNNNGVALDQSCLLYHCEVHRGASVPSNKFLAVAGAYSRVLSCYFHDAGELPSSSGQGLYTAGESVLVAGCFFANCSSSIFGSYGWQIFDNVVYLNTAGGTGITASYNSNIQRNIVYNAAAGTVRGIYINNASGQLTILNNIICGFSGVGGDAIESALAWTVGYNAFWNNTANNTIAKKFLDLTASDVTLAADPFTSAATGDFSLTVAAKAALRDVGWPASYLGAHANTDPHITIGPMQYGEAVASGGGAVSISPAFGRFL